MNAVTDDPKLAAFRARKARNQRARVARVGQLKRFMTSEADLLAILKATTSFDKDTGVFTWTVTRRGRMVAGREAGSKHKRDGYVDIVLGTNRYRAHRLAWLLEYGSMPKGEIDHINGIKSDNRLCNLRLATRSENECNKGVGRANTSGYKGVSFNRVTGRYVANIQRGQTKVRLGLFNTAEEAHAAYCAAAIKMHGEFARLK